MSKTALALLAGLGLVASAAALDPVEVLGNKFFNKDGSQFFIRGVCEAAAAGGVTRGGARLTPTQALRTSCSPRIPSSTRTSAGSTPAS